MYSKCCGFQLPLNTYPDNYSQVIRLPSLCTYLKLERKLSWWAVFLHLEVVYLKIQLYSNPTINNYKMFTFFSKALTTHKRNAFYEKIGSRKSTDNCDVFQNYAIWGEALHLIAQLAYINQ